MSDRTAQGLANLTYEVIATTVDQLAFYQRLHQVKPDLVSAHEIRVVEERLHRLRILFKNLQRRKDD